MRTYTLTLAAGLLLLSGSAFAEAVQGVVAHVTTITDGAGHARVLFRAGPTQAMQDVAVRRAWLRWVRPGGGAPERFHLQVHPLTSAWNAETVAWDRGWTRPGGDFDETLYARQEVELERTGEARFDMTMVFKEILEHGRPAQGFLLTVDPVEGVGLPQADVERLGNLAAATLEVQYRTLPPVSARERSGGLQ